MVLTTTKYGNYTLLEGTALEVAEGLNANNVPKDKVIGIGGTSSAAFAMY